MKLTFNISSLGSNTVHKLLRRQSIRKAVFSIKAVLIGISALCVIVLITSLVSTKLMAMGTPERLDAAVAEALQEGNVPTTVRAKEYDYRAIAKRNIFGPMGAPAEAPTQTAVSPVSDVPLNLIGTFISAGQPPYAIIEEQKQQSQEIFNIGDQVFDTAKLMKIFTDRVEIERNGQREILKIDDFLGGDGGSSETADSRFVVSEQELDQALSNLPLLLTQARAVPYFKDGRSVGLRLFAIKSGSLFEKIGLTNGDILKSINGNDLGDISQAIKLFETLKEERSISLVLERRREEKTFYYQIR